MAKTMIRCFARPALLIVSQSDPCPGESVAALPSKPWKRPISLHNPTDCTTETRGMSIVRQWRRWWRRPPQREVTFAPFSIQEVPLWYSLFQKERAALSCKKSPVACKARVKPVKHGPILAWYLCLFVQQWSCVAAARRTKVPPNNLPLPFSTTRLLGAKAKALIPTGSL